MHTFLYIQYVKHPRSDIYTNTCPQYSQTLFKEYNTKIIHTANCYEFGGKSLLNFSSKSWLRHFIKVKCTSSCFNKILHNNLENVYLLTHF